MVNNPLLISSSVFLARFDFQHDLAQRVRRIRLLLTDCDGVLTDGTVYYGPDGEAMKRFHMRDGMAVERLRTLVGVDVGIVSGETSPSLQRRAAKLNISELHLGVRDKLPAVEQIAARRGLAWAEIAYVGDDVNDVAVMGMVGLAACPADASPFARAAAHLVCQAAGGQGVLREVAELVIAAQATPPTNGTPPAPALVAGATNGRSVVAPGHRYSYDERSEW